MAKGDQTRQKIVEAAAAMFNQRGYEGASLAYLMEKTGLKKGGIYRHFTSKEELAAEAFDYNWTVARRARMEHIDPESAGVERLKQLIANFIEYRSPVPGGCPILNYAIDSDDGNPLLRERVSKALRGWTRRIESLVREAIERGEVSAGTDPKTVATLIIATLEGALMISRLDRSDDALRRAEQHLYQYIDHDLAPRSAKKPALRKEKRSR
ncbi:MAG: TetR/AcrR family transcriptional regulator [Acidobacteriia bacterium]|nr:TetR/AcrR family transcriptional regulator [Terriglobia bacterium]